VSTQPHPISDSSDTVPLDSGGIPLVTRLRQQAGDIGKALWKQRVWLLFVVPFALACWKPMQNSFRNWGNPDNLLIYQSLVPFAVVLLIWQQQLHLQALWTRLQAYPVTDKRRRGNMIPLIIGCLIVLFGHLVYVDSFFGIGLLLILAGTIYYLYGGMILRSIAGPLSLLILMVNPPDSLISQTNKFAINGTAFATSSLLSILGKQSSVVSGFIRFPGNTVEITDPLNGANILVAVLFVAFICAWYQRRTPLYTFCLLIATSMLVILIHLIRVGIYSLTTVNSPGIARLAIGLSPWIMILILSAIVIYGCQSLDLYALRLRVAAKKRAKQSMQNPKKGISRRIEKALIDPIFNASDKGVVYISTQNRKVSKKVSAFFKKLLPSSKKRRNRW
jgi:hypothetical protein